MPPLEVAPFYPKFETVDDYIEALEYCMQSELFAKETYEILALKALNEDSRALFAQLAQMEDEHYRRIKKLYDLLTGFRSRKILPEELEPGGYLLDDRTKARYLFLDLLARGGRGYVFTRDPPEKAREWFKRGDVEVVWVRLAFRVRAEFLKRCYWSQKTFLESSLNVKRRFSP